VQKITPFPWFDGKAEEAANFYISIFKNSRIVDTMRSGDGRPGIHRVERRTHVQVFSGHIEGERHTEAMMQMHKLDIAGLKHAYEAA
jgi:predicted 3-demethylubiquinone-9 3-methyltransferase (glyoxalase superfamily)